MTGIFAAILILAQINNPAVTRALPNAIVCFAGHTEEFHEIYEVKSGTGLRVENTNGDIKISTWRKPHVEVRAIKKTTRDKDELAKAKIEVIIGDVMEIRTKYLEENLRVSVDYTIQIPEQVVVQQIETSNGDIDLIATHGDSKVITANGDVTLRKVSGAVQVHTANGDVDVIDMIGSIRVKTANGDVNVKGATAIIEAATSSGDISVAIKRVPDQGTRIRTTNGSIDLYLDDKLDADIALATSLGKIAIQDLELQAKMSANTESTSVLSGALGQGGNLLNARTSLGNINVYRLAR